MDHLVSGMGIYTCWLEMIEILLSGEQSLGLSLLRDSGCRRELTSFQGLLCIVLQGSWDK